MRLLETVAAAAAAAVAPDKVQTLYTVPVFCSGEGALIHGGLKIPAETKRSDMMNAAFVLAALGVITHTVYLHTHRCWISQ